MKSGKSSVTAFDQYNNLGSGPAINSPVFVSNLSSYITSFSHNLSGLGKYDVGGPFELYKLSRDFKTVTLPPYHISPSGWWIGGTFTCDTIALLGWPSLASAEVGMGARKALARMKAPHAISLSNPSKPESDLLVAVLDTVKDGIPHVVGSTLWRDKTLTAKKAGSEYLNVEFGWKPLVKDIKDFAHTVLNSSSLVAEYERGSGSRQRRGFSFPPLPEESVSGKYTSGTAFPYETQIWGTSDLNWSERTTDRIWFEGAFRYYLAPSGMRRYVQLASKLYGVSLTPDKLWELAPWTWALDWFGNIGDVMSNISHLGPDATVMEWGYIMSEWVKTKTHSQTITGIPFRPGINGHPDAAGKSFHPQITETLTSKLRLGASPYSFAVAPAPLNEKQTAILVALGLSHLT
jgi:hypothetical protein